ncbi:DNA primase [Candidatus Peribacteria bacterium]|nr:DNA primase [Candidatus Peribacteria bacterium]
MQSWERFLDDLKDRTDIVAVVGRYAELQKRGRNYMCRSPFRNERTPSFSVSSDRQFWYDFGASEGGDVIRFIEKAENLSFLEAVELLADEAGMEMPKRSHKATPQQKDTKERLYQLHQAANQYFLQQLQHSSTAQDYLTQRQIDTPTQQRWGIGYGGDAKDGLTHWLLQQGYTREELQHSGVAYTYGEEKTMQDRFWGRVITPVYDARSTAENPLIIAFSGRDILPESTTHQRAKYVNSPENPLYIKSKTLFGYHRARKAIPQHGAALLVEGNFDVITAHTAGYAHTVATCGTSLTEDHLRMLRRVTNALHLCFDNDTAGKKATLRAVEMTLRAGMTPHLVQLPAGEKDLDDTLRGQTSSTVPPALDAALRTPPHALEALLHAMASKLLNGTLSGQTALLDAYLPLLNLVTRPIEREHFLTLLSGTLGQPKELLMAELERLQLTTPPRKPQRLKERDTESRERFTREEEFVGFVRYFFPVVEDFLDAEVLLLLSPGTPPHTLLRKLHTGESLTPEETALLNTWELHQAAEQEDEEVAEQVVERLWEGYITALQVEKTRREQAEKLR